MKTPNRSTLLGLFLLVAAGCSPSTWQPRTVASCPTGEGAEVRERAFLSTMLALHERHYEIVHSEYGASVEARVALRYRSDEYQTTWVIRVQDDGSVVVAQPDNALGVHRRTERWFHNLESSVVSYRCRDLDWLRWRAEDQGLVSVGAQATSGGDT